MNLTKEYMKLIKESPYENTYGGLDLLEDQQGRRFLCMEDCCFGDEAVFGPLTEEQEAAFLALCEVPQFRGGSL